LPFLALAILLVLSSQAGCTFADSSSTVSSQTTLEIPNNDSPEQYEKIERFELDEIDEEDEDETDEWDQHEKDCLEEDEEEWKEDEWDDEEDEEYYEDEEGNINEEDYDYEYDFDEVDFDEKDHYEDDWTPEEYKQIDLIYEGYIVEIARIYGDNWQEEYELVVGKEELYERYLEFQERKQREAEEQRQLSVASHKALLHHEEEQESASNHRVVEKGHNDNDNECSQNCAEDEEESAAAASLGDNIKNAMASDIPPRRHMMVLNTNDSYSVQSNGHDCPAATPTTIITIRNGNSESVIGSI